MGGSFVQEAVVECAPSPPARVVVVLVQRLHVHLALLVRPVVAAVAATGIAALIAKSLGKSVAAVVVIVVGAPEQRGDVAL